MTTATQAAIERLQWLAEDSPDAWRLARLASIAVSVEPNLLRRMRTELLPEADVGTEADLWFSPIVESQGVHAIVFEAEAAALLREQLSADRPLLDKAYSILRDAHSHLAPALQLEETIHVLAARGGATAADEIDAVLRSAIRAMTESEERAREIARWVQRAWPRLDEIARNTPAAVTLALASSFRLRRRAGPPVATGARLQELRWAFPVAGLDPTTVGVQFAGATLHFVESGPGNAMVLPDTIPPLAEISWSAGGSEHVRVVDASVGRSIELGSDATAIRLTTLAGDQYALDAVSAHEAVAVFEGLDPAPWAEVAAACARVGRPAPSGSTMWMTAFHVTAEWLATARDPFRDSETILLAHDRFRDEPAQQKIEPAIYRGTAHILNGDAPGNVLIVSADDDSPAVRPVALATAPVHASRKEAVNALTTAGQAAVVLGHVGITLRAVEGVARVNELDGRAFDVIIESEPPVTIGFLGGPVIIDGQVRGVVAGIEHIKTASGNGHAGSVLRIVGTIEIVEALNALNAERRTARKKTVKQAAKGQPAEPVTEEVRPSREAGGRFAKVVIVGNAGAGKSELIRAISGSASGQRIDDHCTIWWPDAGSGRQDAIVLYESNGDPRWPVVLDLEGAALAVVAVDSSSNPGSAAMAWLQRVRLAAPPVLLIGTKADDSTTAMLAARELQSIAAAEEIRGAASADQPRTVSAQKDVNIEALRDAIHARIDWEQQVRFDSTVFDQARQSAAARLSSRSAVGGRIRPGPDDPEAPWHDDLARLTGERHANGITFRNPSFFEQVVLALVDAAERRVNDVPAIRIDEFGERWSDFVSRWKQLETMEIGPAPVLLAVAAELERFRLAAMTTAAGEPAVILPYMFEREKPPPSPVDGPTLMEANWTGEAWNVFAQLVVRFAYEQGRIRVASWDRETGRGTATTFGPDLYMVASAWGSTAELMISAAERSQARESGPALRWFREALESMLAGNASLTIREDDLGTQSMS